MNLADAPDVLTVIEASRLARVGRNAMYEAVQRGDVFGCRIGKSIRIPKVALVAYLNGEGASSHKVDSWTPAPRSERRVQQAKRNAARRKAASREVRDPTSSPRRMAV